MQPIRMHTLAYDLWVIPGPVNVDGELVYTLDFAGRHRRKAMRAAYRRKKRGHR